VREELDDGDLGLGIRLEARHVGRHRVGEPEGAALGEQPQGTRREDLRVRVEQPERVVARGRALGLEARLAERPEHAELAVAGDGDLRARIAALRDVPRDRLVEPVQRLALQTEHLRAHHLHGKFHATLPSAILIAPRKRRCQPPCYHPSTDRR